MELIEASYTDAGDSLSSNVVDAAGGVEVVSFSASGPATRTALLL